MILNAILPLQNCIWSGPLVARVVWFLLPSLKPFYLGVAKLLTILQSLSAFSSSSTDFEDGQQCGGKPWPAALIPPVGGVVGLRTPSSHRVWGRVDLASGLRHEPCSSSAGKCRKPQPVSDRMVLSSSGWFDHPQLLEFSPVTRVRTPCREDSVDWS